MTYRQSMTHMQKSQEIRRIVSLFPEGTVAGGYARDILLGTQDPKDIDLWIPTRGMQRQALQSLSSEILARVGQVLDTTALPDDNYGDSRLIVFKSTGPSVDTEAVDVIFYESNAKSVDVIFDGFDFDICKAYLTSVHGGDAAGTPEFFRARTEMKERFRYRPGVSLPKMLDHIMRIKRKYPDYKLLFDFQDEISKNVYEMFAPTLYRREIENGAPRPVLSPQTEDPYRDPIRLDAREERARVINQVYREYLTRAATTASVSSGVGSIFSGTSVSSGFSNSSIWDNYVGRG